MDNCLYQVNLSQDTVEFVSNGPWNSENELVLVRPFYGLNKDFFGTMEVGRKVVKILDSCSILQLGEDGQVGTKFFHFRVLVLSIGCCGWVYCDMSVCLLFAFFVAT